MISFVLVYSHLSFMQSLIFYCICCCYGIFHRDTLVRVSHEKVKDDLFIVTENCIELCKIGTYRFHSMKFKIFSAKESQLTSVNINSDWWPIIDDLEEYDFADCSPDIVALNQQVTTHALTGYEENLIADHLRQFYKNMSDDAGKEITKFLLLTATLSRHYGVNAINRVLNLIPKRLAYLRNINLSQLTYHFTDPDEIIVIS
jgi:hypothetical protein